MRIHIFSASALALLGVIGMVRPVAASTIYFGDQGNGYLYSADTTTGATTKIYSGSVAPQGIAVDASGNVFFGDYGSTAITELTPGGTLSTFANLPSADDGPMTFDANGNLFVASVSSIYEFAPDGAMSTFARGVNFTGLAFDSSGNLFAVDAAVHRIYEYTPGGTRSTFALNGVNGVVLGQPEGLAFDSSGNLFLAGGAYGQIYEFNTLGQESTFSASGVTLESPIGLAFDSSGNLFVSDDGGSGAFSIAEFNTSGVGTVVENLSDNRYIAIDNSTAPTPEPATYGMVMGGLSLCGLMARRARRQAPRHLI